MGSIDKLCERARYWCTTVSLGYDQGNRWDVRDGGEVDCSSFALWCAWEAGFLPEKPTWGNSVTIAQQLAPYGWAKVSNNGNPKKGDILVNQANHVAIWLGDCLAQASIDENGNISGGQGGDQTGQETNLRGYYNYPWDYYLRYEGADTSDAPTDVPMPRYRAWTKEHGWLEWMEGLECSDGCGDDYAGVPGCWIYDMQFENLGTDGWYEIERADGSKSRNESGNTDSAVTGIVVYYATPNPGQTGYYKAKYQAHWLGSNPGWGKWEYDDEDGGAGKDTDSPLDMVRLTLERA